MTEPPKSASQKAVAEDGTDATLNHAQPAEELDVGYGRPPKHSRFKPGHSGNPRGRPKGPKRLIDAVEASLSEKVTVNENGSRRQIAKREAIAKQLVNKAASGDLAAIKLLSQLMNKTHDQNGPSVTDPETANESDASVIAAIVRRFGGEAA